MNRIIKFIVLDILRNKIVILYTLILSVLAWSAFSLEDNSSKGLLTLLNVILLTVPLISVIFSTIYLYNSTEFVELLLSQPINRNKIWWSLFIGLLLPLIFSFIIGAGLPILIFAPNNTGFMMILIGIFITAIFVSIAFISSISTRDKAKGIGISILLWLFFALLYDGIILFLLFQFADYPIENIMVGVSSLNPIDLARILILLHLDVSAMLGYTGAVFKNFYGTELGIVVTLLVLTIWFLVPFLISLSKFKKKDL